MSGGSQQDLAADRQHGVARLSIVQGDVNVKRADTGELVAAVMNAPLVAPDRLQTSPGSRAEVELDSANLIRLAPNTDLGFAGLEYHRYQVQLGAGTIIYRVLRDSDAQAEVDTPSIAVRPVAQGEYRISVMEDGTTQITVRSGTAEIYSPRGSQQLGMGRTTLVRGNPADPEFQTTYEIGRDQFDDWSANRDRELLASQSYQYVSRDVDGADDLDAYGNWVPSGYGQVWAPRSPAPDWSPYSSGQWNWTGYYGWTWVDNAPWGWAPYHYGRWFWNGGYGWCWWPGARLASYLWSPALVGFFGWGGIGIGGWAGIGWVALAPFELFHAVVGPLHFSARDRYGYGGFPRGDVARMYRNGGIRGGAMTAAASTVSADPTGISALPLPAQLRDASLFRGQMPVSPSASQFPVCESAATPNPRLASAANRQFFQHSQIGQRSGLTACNSGPAEQLRSFASNLNRRQRRLAAFRPAGWLCIRQGFTGGQESSGWHQFGQPQHSSGAPYSGYSAPRYNSPSGGARYSVPSTPHYSSPAMPRYSAPSGGRYSAPHYSAPSPAEEAAEAPPGCGSSHAGGGGHSSSGGHHGR